MKAHEGFARNVLRWAIAVAALAAGAGVAIDWGTRLDQAEGAAAAARANQRALWRLEAVFDEFHALGREIDSRTAYACSQGELEYFRRFLFRLTTLRDIGFLEQDRLLCSTALGVIDNPRPNSPPDFILRDGLEVYAYRVVRIVEGRRTMVLQTERYNALVDPGLIESLNQLAIAGALAVKPAPDADAWPLSTAAPKTPVIHDVQCSHTYGFCTELTVDSVGLTDNRHQRGGLAVLGAGSGLAVFLVIQTLVWRRYSSTSRLRRAIKRCEFEAVVQPVFRMPEGRVAGLELLARWPGAPEWLAQPERFISEAELNGLIQPLTELMIRLAGREVADWLKADRNRWLAINISTAALREDQLIKALEQNLVRSGVEPGQIVLELTERSLASGQREALIAIAAAGFCIYVDDFGEGYSSLSYLHDLPVHGVKISRSFVSGLGTDSPKVDLVKAMIDVARKLGLEIVLEGIETESQHAAARRLGDILVQGFHYAMPTRILELPPDTVRPLATPG